MGMNETTLGITALVIFLVGIVVMWRNGVKGD
jgi:hypothetical protein